MRQEVAIVELRYHETLLENISKLFLKLNNVELTLFISKEVFGNLSDDVKDDNRIRIKTYNVSRNSNFSNPFKLFFYLRHVSKACDDIQREINRGNYSLIIFETLQNFPFLLSSYKGLSKIKGKKGAIVHNCEIWSGNGRNNLSMLTKINDKLSRVIIRKWLKVLDFLITLEDTQTDYLRKNGITLPIITLRGKFAFEEYKTADNSYDSGNLSFVIPGSVDLARRNYIDFLNVFEKLSIEHEEIRAYFLGKMISKAVKERIQSSDVLRRKVKFWEDYVPRNEFNTVISAAHFIVLPLANNFDYGNTKISGALYDALVLGKPVIISNNMKIKDEYLDGMITYSDLESALKKGIEIVKNGEYHELLEKAKKVREKFKPARFVERLSSFMEQK